MTDNHPSPPDQEQQAAEPASPSAPLAAWPPPGLERIQGDLWNVIERLGIGGAILSFPLLTTLTLQGDPWRPSIFGDSWWILLLTTAVAIGLLLSGYVQLLRVLTRWRKAVQNGYAERTVALVLADGLGDMGFVVQGARTYSVMSEGTRRGLITARLIRVTLLLAATLWLSVGFVLGLVLAARGTLAEFGLVAWTLGPPVLAAFLSMFLSAWRGTVLRKAK
ncbi:MAG: hypothetical protein JRJ84_25600, partial [Deltaproteobacteria bacterium]|nr:hypothetical protein [Deltaproteobacteria bacterium]